MGFTKAEVAKRILTSFDFDNAFLVHQMMKHTTYRDKDQMIRFANDLVERFLDSLEAEPEMSFAESGYFRVHVEYWSEGDYPYKPSITLTYIPLCSHSKQFRIKPPKKDERVPF